MVFGALGLPDAPSTKKRRDAMEIVLVVFVALILLFDRPASTEDLPSGFICMSAIQKLIKVTSIDAFRAYVVLLRYPELLELRQHIARNRFRCGRNARVAKAGNTVAR
jgi:hypothetical protein